MNPSPQTITVTIGGRAADWLRSQGDQQAAIQTVLDAYLARNKTPFEDAVDLLHKNIPALPSNFEFEIPQVIGTEAWEKLSRTTRLAFGKYVRGHAESFGLEFVRKTSANHAVYRRKSA
jgi:hypothetical protein